VQVKLLRVLQERKIRRVGGAADIAVAARIVAATNRDLAAEVQAGRFREDLFYRLNVIQIRMPPLRDRREDVPIFLAYFLQRFAAEQGRAPPRLSDEARALLLAWDFPGNLRELANVVERVVTLADGDVVQPGLLPPTMRGGAVAKAAPPAEAVALPAEGMDLQDHLDGIERKLLEDALARCSGVKTEAAKLLGLTFRSLRYRLAKYGID
jgi:two-component system response regulator PilR (NtrC family)